MTGCERVLEALRGGPMHTKDLYRLTGCMVHSRVADLRKRGHEIEYDASSQTYRLLCREGTCVDAFSPVSAPDGPSLQSSPAGSIGSSPVGQLDLFGGAT